MKQEFGEVEEPVPPGTVGSSTMPQKRNPKLSQDIMAAAAQIRALVPLALEAMQTEHEADRTTSIMMSRALVQACELTGDMLQRLIVLFDGLQVFPARMRENLDLSGGLIMAEALMLELGKQIGRQRAHDAVYEAAQASATESRPFRETLAEDPHVAAGLTPPRSRRCWIPPATRGSAGSSRSAGPRGGARSPPAFLPVRPGGRSAGAEAERAQLLKVRGLVPAGHEHDVVVAPFTQPMQPLAGDLGRALEVARILGAVGACGGTVEIDPHVGDDGALASEIAKARDALTERPPAAARPDPIQPWNSRAARSIHFEPAHEPMSTGGPPCTAGQMGARDAPPTVSPFQRRPMMSSDSPRRRKRDSKSRPSAAKSAAVDPRPRRRGAAPRTRGEW